MRRRCCASSTQCFGNCRWDRIAREGKLSTRATRNLRAEGHRKRDNLAGCNRGGQRSGSSYRSREVTNASKFLSVMGRTSQRSTIQRRLLVGESCKSSRGAVIRITCTEALISRHFCLIPRGWAHGCSRNSGFRPLNLGSKWQVKKDKRKFQSWSVGSGLKSQSVLLIVRETTIDAEGLHGRIHFCGADITDRTRNIEDKLSYVRRRGQSFWGRQYVAGEYTLDKVIVEIPFRHCVNFPEDDFSFRLGRIQHNERDAAAIRPMASLAKKNLSQLFERTIFYRIRLVNDDCQRLITSASRRSKQGLRAGGHQSNRQDDDKHAKNKQDAYSGHRYVLKSKCELECQAVH